MRYSITSILQPTAQLQKPDELFQPIMIRSELALIPIDSRNGYLSVFCPSKSLTEIFRLIRTSHDLEYLLLEILVYESL